MGIDQAQFLAQSTLWSLLIMSLPVLLLTTVVSLVFSIFQAVTQIQDQTLPFVVKFGTVIVVLMVSGDWIVDGLSDLFIEALALTDRTPQPF